MKKKKIIIAVVVILLLLVTAGIVVWRVFFPDLFKSKQDAFWDKAESAVGLNSSKFSDYSKFLDDYENLSDKSYKTQLNISANLQLDDLDSDTQDIINNSKIKYESYIDAEEKRIQEKVGVYSKKSEVLTLDLITDGETYGLGCSDLSDKYYTATLDDLLTYLEKDTSIPYSTRSEISSLKRIYSGKNNTDIYKLLYISEDDLKHFDDTYRGILKKLISKDCYTSKNNVEVSVNGKKIKTTAYYLTLTGKDGYKLLKDLADVIKKDDVLAKVIAEKANLLSNGNSGFELDKDDVSEYIEEMLDQMLSSLEDLEDDDEHAIQIAVYSDKSNARIEFNVIDDVEDMDDKETAFVIENSFEKNTDTEKKGKLSLSTPNTKLGTINYELVNKTDASKFALSYEAPESEVSISIDVSSEGNIDKEPVEVRGSFKMVQEDQSMEISFDGSVEIDDDISVPTLTSKNSIDILNLSKDKQQEEINKLLKKASEVLPSRLKSLGIDVKAEDIYKEPTTIAPTTTDTTTTTTDATVPTTTTPTVPATITTPDVQEIQKTITEIQQDVQQNVQNNTVDMEELQKNIQKTQDLVNSLQR